MRDNTESATSPESRKNKTAQSDHEYSVANSTLNAPNGRSAQRRWWLLLVLTLVLAGLWLLHAWLRARLEVSPESSSSVQFLLIARAVLTSSILAVVTSLFGVERGWSLDLGYEGLADAPEARLEQQRSYARWFVRARWIAAAASLGLLTLAGSEHVVMLCTWWSAIVVTNLWFKLAVEQTENPTRLITLQVIADLVILTGFLNASGGLENPLFSFYLFHTLIAHILLPRRTAFGLTVVAGALFLVMAVGEYAQLLPHHTNLFFPHDAPNIESHLSTEDHSADHHSEDTAHASHDPFFVLGRTIPFLAVMLLTSYFTSIVVSSLRRREEDLEAAVRESRLERRTLEGVVYASGVGIMQFLPGIEVRWASARVQEWLDGERCEVGLECPLYRKQLCETCVVSKTFTTGNPERAERSLLEADGRHRHFRHSSSPILDSSGDVIQVVEVIEDITATKALEEEAIRAGKLSVLGRMAAGIAHEVGNPLSSMSTRLTLLDRKRDNEFVGESVRALRTQVERISRIVHGVSQFSRRGSDRRKSWDMNGLVAETLSIVKLDQRCHETKFVFEPQGPISVAGERDYVVQILLNLLLNAAEAGEVGMENSVVEVKILREDQWVHVKVTDHGAGITEESRRHLFEPFYSTKEEGSGLGLAICLGLANAQGGSIEAESTSTGGACFTLILPSGPRTAADGRKGLYEPPEGSSPR